MLTAGLAFVMGSTLAAADTGPCLLRRVVPTDPHAHAVPLTAGHAMPRDALVQVRPEVQCPDGVGVRLLASNPVYGHHNVPGPSEAPLCIPAEALAAPGEAQWMTRAPFPPRPDAALPQPVGWLLDPIRDTGDCAATMVAFGDHTLPIERLGLIRPIDAAALAAVWQVQARAIQLVGPLGVDTIHWTHTGRVSLPWVDWDSAEDTEAVWKAEQLDTPERREKAVLAAGPADTWLYFAGADPVRTDIWGEPDAVVALMDALAAWRKVCVALPEGSSATCPVQLGDISYTSDLRPDPLGHKDHFAGRCVDIRLFRADASRYEAWWNRPDDRPGFVDSVGYSQTLTAAFIAHLLARDDVQKVLFNDPEIHEATPARGHDDHLHVCFSPS